MAADSDAALLAELATRTTNYRKHNDSVAERQSAERGSLPPSAPKLQRALAVEVPFTPERAKQISRALIREPGFLALVAMLDVEGDFISPAEFGTFCRAAVKGAQQK